MKKRLLSILLCLTLAATSLVGCGGGADREGDQIPAPVPE